MHLVGIDPSLSNLTVAIANSRSGGPLAHSLRSFQAPKAEAKTVRQRLARYEAFLEPVVDLVAAHAPAEQALVLLEGYSYNSRGAVITLGEFGGLLRKRLLQELAQGSLVEVSPAVLKRFVTGKGNANKAAVTSALASRYRLTFDSDDEADAFGLMHLAAVAARVEPHENQARAQAAEAVRLAWTAEGGAPPP